MIIHNDNPQFSESFLDDYIFWNSKQIYVEIMSQFISKKLTGLEFLRLLSIQVESDIQKSRLLAKDYKKKQIKIDLNPDSYGFSIILLEQYRIVQYFSDDLKDQKSVYCISESQLRTQVSEFLLKIENFH